jgi:hypothetical protein
VLRVACLPVRSACLGPALNARKHPPAPSLPDPYADCADRQPGRLGQRPQRACVASLGRGLA